MLIPNRNYYQSLTGTGIILYRTVGGVRTIRKLSYYFSASLIVVCDAFHMISTYPHTEFYMSMSLDHSSKNALKVSGEPPVFGTIIIGPGSWGAGLKQTRHSLMSLQS